MTTLVALKKCTNPRIRLVCVPHAGGWPSSFQTWRHHVPDHVELLIAQLPGRGALLYDTPLRSVAHQVEQLSAALTSYLDVPIVLYGHSFGSIICYELSKRLPQLVSLNVSAIHAPHVLPSRPFVHQMDDAALLENLNRMGGISAELLANKKLRPYVFNTIRADFEALETYQCHEQLSTTVPLTVFGARDDPAVSTEILYSWHTYGVSQVTINLFHGGHFYPYLETNIREILASILRFSPLAY